MLSLLFLASVITLVSCGILLDPPPTTQPPPVTLSQEQIRLNDICAKRCVKVESCFLSSDIDPRYFIYCAHKVGVYRLCGHGACFDPYLDTCVNAAESNCSLSLCFNKLPNERFGHDDNNCKTFWECSPSGEAVAKCCPHGFVYEPHSTDCIPMIGNECMNTCNDMKEPLCSKPGIYNEFANDGNCRTYHECEHGVATSACCPQGERYDVEARDCVVDVNNLCTSDCPLKSCKMPGVNSFRDPTYCGAYSVCNGTVVQEKRCCPGAKVYDDKVETCVEPPFGETKANCTDLCPQIFKHDCTLVGVEGGNGFRHIGIAEVIDCPSSTFFEESTCACSGIIANPIDNACRMAIDLTMTSQGLLRNGTEHSATITQFGQIRPGKIFTNGMETMQFSSLVFLIPLFRGAIEHFFMEIVYQPDNAPAPGKKMILISNCYQDAENAATVEVAITDDNSIVLSVIVIDANSHATRNPVILAVPYQKKVWNNYRVWYHNGEVKVVNDGGTPATTYENSVLVTGVKIVQASEGLEIGGCISHGASDVHVNNFDGSIATVKLAKCVMDTWKETIQPIAG